MLIHYFRPHLKDLLLTKLVMSLTFIFTILCWINAVPLNAKLAPVLIPILTAILTDLVWSLKESSKLVIAYWTVVHCMANILVKRWSVKRAEHCTHKRKQNQLAKHIL